MQLSFSCHRLCGKPYTLDTYTPSPSLSNRYYQGCIDAPAGSASCPGCGCSHAARSRQVRQVPCVTGSRISGYGTGDLSVSPLGWGHWQARRRIGGPRRGLLPHLARSFRNLYLVSIQSNPSIQLHHFVALLPKIEIQVFRALSQRSGEDHRSNAIDNNEAYKSRGTWTGWDIQEPCSLLAENMPRRSRVRFVGETSFQPLPKVLTP